MKTRSLVAAAAALTASIVLTTACSKSETATPAASQPATSVAEAPTTGQAPIVPGTEAVPQPTPGTPVATFTPAPPDQSPMLPTLGSSPAPIQEHDQTPDKANVRRIAPEEAAMLVQSGDAIIVDVRSKDSFEAHHVKGAINIPFPEISARARAELPPTRWIIPYCT